MAIVAEYKSYYKIGELSKILGIEPHVIRYWETLFTDIRPETTGTNRKLYTRSDLETLAVVQYLVREAQFTIEGAKQRIAELKHSGELATLKLELVEYRGAVGSLSMLSKLMTRRQQKKIETAAEPNGECPQTAQPDATDTPSQNADHCSADQNNTAPEETPASVRNKLQAEFDLQIADSKSEIEALKNDLNARDKEINDIRAEYLSHKTACQSLGYAFSLVSDELRQAQNDVVAGTGK